jgi:hypothetical protein
MLQYGAFDGSPDDGIEARAVAAAGEYTYFFYGWFHGFLLFFVAVKTYNNNTYKCSAVSIYKTTSFLLAEKCFF